MDVNLIKRFQHFLAVVEEGHFGRAASRLGMSQPPLTAQIQALERGLGVKLLDRSRQGTRPTPEGAILLPAVRRLEEAARAVEALAREVRSGKRAVITVGCVTSGLFEPLPRLMRSFQAARPDVVITIREMDTAVAMEALRAGEVDVALARLERDRLPIRVIPGPPDLLTVAVAESDPIAEQSCVDLAAFAGRPMVMLPRAISPAYFDGLVAACRQAGFEPNAAREVTSALAQLALVAGGLGVALVSSGMACLAPPGVVFRALRKPVASVGVALAWNVERESEISREMERHWASSIESAKQAVLF
jgi:DNA-binding transcriptional LysR family regulator